MIYNIKNIITIWSKKGGVGKTSIANTLLRDLGWNYITNDKSEILISYNKCWKFSSKLLFKENTIYDFGGFDSPHIHEILPQSKVIIIPFFSDVNSINQGIDTIKELLKKGIDSNRILIVLNRIRNTKEINIISNYIDLKLKDIKLKKIILRKSQIFENSIKEHKSISDIYNQNNFTKNQYKGIYSDYIKLLDFINQEFNLESTNISMLLNSYKKEKLNTKKQ